MIKLLKAYKYRLYPNKAQAQFFEQTFGCVRFVYNWGLDAKINSYTKTGKSPNYFDLAVQLPQLKKQYEWLKIAPANTLQQSLRHLDNAYTNFFHNRAGFPNFKSKKHSKPSFTETDSIEVMEKHIKLPKVKLVKASIHRPPVGKLKSIVVSRTKTDKYFASCLFETGEPIPEKKPITKAVGIDLGIKNFAVLSDGTKIDNPKFFRRSQARLKTLQRRASRTVKGSNRSKAAYLKIAKQYEKISNQRADFLHKVSKKLVVENQYIAIEDLNVSGMLKNHKLAKCIQDASWSKFVEMLTYKSEWYGTTLVKIGRFEPSTKRCDCGYINNLLTLNDRMWICPECGQVHDRDIHAAKNILAFSGWQPAVVDAEKS